MSAFLDPAELFRVTGKKRYKAQCRALERLGIRYRKAASGEPLVRPDDLDEPRKPAHRRRRGHRWDRIGNAAQVITLARSRSA